jgi:photosystem II stability/assembly factor-like uncharacterized protein
MEARTPGIPAVSNRSLRIALTLGTLILAGLCSIQPVQAQGHWQVIGHPTIHNLNRLCFLNMRGWVVGDVGTILMTEDGAKSWTTQATPIDFDLVDIDMIDERTGWALARRYSGDGTESGTRVLRTVDGQEWVLQASFDEIFHALAFIDADRGFLGGDQGRLLRTVDGGETWAEAVVEDPETARWPIRDFNFYNATFGLATGGLYDAIGLVWRTVDGGATWTHERVAGEPIFGTHFFDEDNVVCVGGDLDWGSGVIISGSEPGRWDYSFLGIWGQASAVSFRNPTEGWAPLGFPGTYMYTLDMGHSWTALPTPDGTAMNDVVFTDANTGYMVGAGGTVLGYSSAVTSVGSPDAASPERITLSVPSPAIGDGAVPIQYSLTSGTGEAVIRVYNVDGRLVRALDVLQSTPGTHRTEWNRRDTRGRLVASGMYFIELSARGQRASTKTVLAE